MNHTRKSNIIYCLLLSLVVHAGLLATFVHAVKRPPEPIALITPIQVALVHEISDSLGNSQSEFGGIDTDNTLSGQEAKKALEKSAALSQPSVSDQYVAESENLQVSETAPVDQTVQPAEPQPEPVLETSDPIVPETEITNDENAGSIQAKNSISELETEPAHNDDIEISVSNREFISEPVAVEELSQEPQDMPDSVPVDQKLEFVQAPQDFDVPADLPTEVASLAEPENLDRLENVPEPIAMPVRTSPSALEAVKTAVESSEPPPALENAIESESIAAKQALPKEESAILENPSASPTESLPVEIPLEAETDWDQMTVELASSIDELNDSAEFESNAPPESVADLASASPIQLTALDIDSQYFSSNSTLTDIKEVAATEPDSTTEEFQDQTLEVPLSSDYPQSVVSDEYESESIASVQPLQEEKLELPDSPSVSPEESIAVEVLPEPETDWDQRTVALVTSLEVLDDLVEPSIGPSPEPAPDLIPAPSIQLTALDIDSQYISMTSALTEIEDIAAPASAPALEHFQDNNVEVSVESNALPPVLFNDRESELIAAIQTTPQNTEPEIPEIPSVSQEQSSAVEVVPERETDWDQRRVALTSSTDELDGPIEFVVSSSPEPVADLIPESPIQLSALDIDSQYLSMTHALTEIAEVAATELESNVESVREDEVILDAEDADQFAGILPDFELNEDSSRIIEFSIDEVETETLSADELDTQFVSIADFDTYIVARTLPEVDSIAVAELEAIQSDRPVEQPQTESSELSASVAESAPEPIEEELAKTVESEPASAQVEKSPVPVVSSDEQLAAMEEQPPLEADKESALPESVQKEQPKLPKQFFAAKQSELAQPSASELKIDTSAAQQASLGRAAGESLPKYGVKGLPNPTPKYPRRSRAKGEQGKVILQVVVNQKGRADEVTVFKSSGYSRLDKAARKAVRKWRFKPAQKDGRSIQGIVQVPISFVLEQS